jgi:hypothetical protein
LGAVTGGHRATWGSSPMASRNRTQATNPQIKAPRSTGPRRVEPRPTSAGYGAAYFVTLINHLQPPQACRIAFLSGPRLYFSVGFVGGLA